MTTIEFKNIIERAPNHDNKNPCFTAWELRSMTPGLPAIPRFRPKWSIQMYDTTPQAGDEDHIRALVTKIHEDTLESRGGMGRNRPDRIDLYGMPMPVDTPEEVRVAQCVAHQRAEIAARNATGNGDFFIPPSFGHFYNRIIVVIDKPEETWGDDEAEGEGAFITVDFDKLPRTPHHAPDPRARRMPKEELDEDGLWDCREGVETFNDNYVVDGVVVPAMLART